MILVAAALVSMLAVAQPPARPPQTDQTEAVQRGMRLTVAQVFSPKGLPYTGRGVLPDIVVDSPSMPTPARRRASI